MTDAAKEPLSAAERRMASLPSSLAPRGLSRIQAATYIGVSPTLFDTMVAEGRMPKPKKINKRSVWDKEKLDDAFDALPDDDRNDWDDD